MAYGISQHRLWEMALTINNNNQSIPIKLCSVELTDITSKKSQDAKLNSYLQKILSSWQSKTLSTELLNSENTVSPTSFGNVIVDENHGYKIVGLDNRSLDNRGTGNFCYMNSITQVFVCLILHSGCTYDYLVTSQRFIPKCTFKL